MRLVTLLLLRAALLCGRGKMHKVELSIGKQRHCSVLLDYLGRLLGHMADAKAKADLSFSKKGARGLFAFGQWKHWGERPVGWSSRAFKYRVNLPQHRPLPQAGSPNVSTF